MMVMIGMMVIMSTKLKITVMILKQFYDDTNDVLVLVIITIINDDANDNNSNNSNIVTKMIKKDV